MPRDKRLDLLQSKFVESLRNLGSATALPIALTDDELIRLAAVVFHDTGHDKFIPDTLRADLAKVGSYYDLSTEWLES